MDTRTAGIVIGLLVASLPAHAQQSSAPNPAQIKAHRPAAKVPAPQKSHIATRTEPRTEPAGLAADQTGTLGRRKSQPRAKAVPPSAVANSYAAMPEAERRAIQSDLAWLGDYEGNAAENFDDRMIAAIKAFQKRHGGKETGILNEQERALLTAAVKGPEEAVGWRLQDDPATGARVGLPGKLVPQTGTARTGSRWTSGQGQIQVETFRLREAALPALFDEEKKTPRGRRIAYSVLKPESFVMSGEQGLKQFLIRVDASGTELRGITILYDQATAGLMDRIAVAMSNAFQGFPDPNAGPPPGRKRSVEYATAIVVSARGDLITLAHVTDECRSITVPGLGHADRTAEDAANDLALIRLYGARGLVAAPLAGDSAKADDLTLFGIADPLAQAGDATVTSAAAHRTAQGVEPAPKPGFSGAAAIDAQGRFAGIVDLKSPLVAGIDPTTPQAAIVPADAARAFLEAHGISPAAGHSAIGQSIVRVICVRK